MTVSIDGTAGITTPAVTTSGTDEAATQTQGGVAMPRMVLSTTQNTTSGASIDFITIPVWVKRITLMFNGVSTTGTSIPMIQLGSGSVQTTGYNSAGSVIISSAASSNSTTGFLTSGGVSDGSGTTRHGMAILSVMGGNVWTFQSVLGASDSAATRLGGGSVTLSGAIDRLRLTTVGGSETFDAGSVNILYEG